MTVSVVNTINPCRSIRPDQSEALRCMIRHLLRHHRESFRLNMLLSMKMGPFTGYFRVMDISRDTGPKKTRNPRINPYCLLGESESDSPDHDFSLLYVRQPEKPYLLAGRCIRHYYTDRACSRTNRRI